MSTNFLRRRTLRVTAFTAFVLLGSLLFLNYSTRVGAQNGAGSGTRLLRTPTVSATQIGFAYANNIWVVPRSGGSARRIGCTGRVRVVLRPGGGTADPRRTRRGG